jgi:hypothetical protein
VTVTDRTDLVAKTDRTDPTNLPQRINDLEKHVEVLEQMIAHLSARMGLKFEWTSPPKE